METVLLADNNRYFLETRAEFLTQAGYDVITALTLQEAERVLGEGRVQGAILDMRLENDDDPKDESGLALAKKSDYRLIPKILLTRYPTYEIVREALSAANAGLPPAVDFVAKQEGPEALISALKRLFSLHVRDNPSLAIQFCGGDVVSFSNLATLLEPSLSGEQLPGRTAELTNLFRQLFYGKTEVRIGRLLWRDEGRAALLVFTFAPGKAQPQVVVCGRSDLIIDEARRRQQFAPDAPAENGTTLIRTCETVHFAVNAYALAEMTMEGSATLAELYRERPEQTFNPNHLTDGEFARQLHAVLTQASYMLTLGARAGTNGKED
jgi:CheY-like chemotaxis protein